MNAEILIQIQFRKRSEKGSEWKRNYIDKHIYIATSFWWAWNWLGSNSTSSLGLTLGFRLSAPLFKRRALKWERLVDSQLSTLQATWDWVESRASNQPLLPRKPVGRLPCCLLWRDLTPLATARDHPVNCQILIELPCSIWGRTQASISIFHSYDLPLESPSEEHLRAVYKPF